ncbi:hypothetical protein E2C01_052448 [Portunus trituberculatus]|uniref:Uncharacterized protein n=1 Tax=Portunus trituberculatus TaxID=210409 RepID=A0A5B7GLU4_PORTR|nr:hypothetical protein [Portunus trituberculatus]
MRKVVIKRGRRVSLRSYQGAFDTAGRWGKQVSPSEWENSNSLVTPKYTELVATLRVVKEAGYFHSPCDSRNRTWSSNMRRENS